MDKESKNGHSDAEKPNRFQSGFRDMLFLMKISGFVFSIRIQTEQTVNRKKSGFRASRLFLIHIFSKKYLNQSFLAKDILNM